MTGMARTIPGLLGAAALALGGLPAQDAPSPSELERARPAAMQIMAQRVVALAGGDYRRASGELVAAAFAEPDDSVRFLLLEQAVDIAVQNDDIWLALSHTRAMAGPMNRQSHVAGVALLNRLAQKLEQPDDHAQLAAAALQAAHEHMLEESERPMLAYYDVAVRAAMRSDHAAFYAQVRDRLSYLRGVRTLGAELDRHLDANKWPGRVVMAGLLAGELRMLEPFAVGELASLFDDLGDVPADLPARDLDAAQLLALAERCRDPRVRTGFLRCAQQHLLRSYDAADEPTRRATCRQLVAITERLCTGDGLSRLRFRRPNDRDQLVFANGDWNIADGLLVGEAQGSDNYATHRVSFSSANVVVVRGGIRSKEGLNFRCKVGDVNLLLNWEVQPQNHLWLNGTSLRNEPPALQVGEEHTIVFLCDGARAHVCIDGEHMWTVASQLTGTISVYPAFGSEIFVREILVDGRPDGLVQGPAGVMM